MKIAIAFKGISYFRNYLHKENFYYDIDFEDTYQSILNCLLLPLINQGHQVDTFIYSYHNIKEQKLLQLYQPKNYKFTEFKPVSLSNTYQSGHKLMVELCEKALDLVEEYEQKNNFEYDFIILTRLDLYFFQKITEIGVDFSKFNFTFYHIAEHESNNPIFTSEDCWFGFPKSSKKILRETFKECNELGESTHALGRLLLQKKIVIRYLFGEKGAGATDYPFYKLGRFLFGNVAQIRISDIPNIKMNRIILKEENPNNLIPLDIYFHPYIYNLNISALKYKYGVND